MNQDLKPCPFCGGHEARPIPTQSRGHFSAIVYCPTCNSTTCLASYCATAEEAWERSVAAWNRRQQHIEWIETEREAPAEIGARVLVCPIDDEVDAATYLGEGMYRIWDFAVSGADFTHWAQIELPRRHITCAIGVEKGGGRDT